MLRSALFLLLYFVFIQIGARGWGEAGNMVDTGDKYKRLAKVCEEKKVPYGFYFYSTALSYEEADEEVKIVNHEDNVGESEQIEIKEPEGKKANVLSTLKKSMGDEEEVPKREKKSIEDLELTDDLFNFIDSMYDERNDD